MIFLRLFDRFVFAEAPPARLAILRILVGLFALYMEAGRYNTLVGVADTDEALFEPVGIIRLLDKPMSPELFQGLAIACLAANVIFILGWRHHVTGPVFAWLLLWVLCYRNSWAMIYHSGNLVQLHVIVLAFSRSADALSLDARRRIRNGESAPAASWRYGWPLLLICALTATTYFVSGVAKVAGPLGWSWASGDGLRSQIAADALRKELLGDVSSPVFHRMYNELWLFEILAIGSLVLELGAPLFLLNRRVAQVWAVNAFLMHWGIYFIMGITFRYQISGVAYAAFFSWERLLHHWPLRMAEPPRGQPPIHEELPLGPDR